ncbi:MAG: sulfatase-like hydrolase/transferase [Candidatus Altiarchaeota archaeon]|nr:sulfatase-like hydrolase/transferase [Candidatus Altiarchaeota archaeon]
MALWKNIFFLLFVFTLVIPLSTHVSEESFHQCVDCNVILISIDTLRADHVSSYGYFRNTTPNIDSFFSNGFFLMNAFSHTPYTSPSHMSLLTSTYPAVHKIRNNDQLSTHRLRGLITLAEVLSDNGYKTAAFTGGGNVAREQGFDRGFQLFHDGCLIDQVDEDGLEPIFSWIDESKNQKFLLFLHTYIPHDPYVPPRKFNIFVDPNYSGSLIKTGEEFQEILQTDNLSNFNGKRKLFWKNMKKTDISDVRHMISLYDGDILYADYKLGMILRYLEENNLVNNSIIILFSDHGEEFMEHGGFLHEKLYDETLHVPLIIKMPHSDGGVITSPAGLIDVSPTILEYLGIPAPNIFQGSSLKPLMESEEGDRIIYSQKTNNQVSIRTPKWKYISLSGDEGLYDLVSDPNETQDVKLQNTGQTTWFRDNLKEFNSINYKLGQNRYNTDINLTNSTIQRLKELGYAS